MAGIKNIILPEDNEKDLTDIPDEYKKGLKFHFVNKIEDAVGLAIPKLKLKEKK
jgi:ATP-dependent Lon protease